MGYAYQLQGNLQAARRAYTEAIGSSRASGNIVVELSALSGLGNVQEAEYQLYKAAETYKYVLKKAEELLLPLTICEQHMALARIYYQWNEKNAALLHIKDGLKLSSQIQNYDRNVLFKIIHGRIMLSQGNIAETKEIIREIKQYVFLHNVKHISTEITELEIFFLLHKGNITKAYQLSEKNNLIICQARVNLICGNISEAIMQLNQIQQKLENKQIKDRYFKYINLTTMILQTIALYMSGKNELAFHLLSDTLRIAEEGGLIRVFLDEGFLLNEIISKINKDVDSTNYMMKLLQEYEEEYEGLMLREQILIEPLSSRELEILKLIAIGFSNKQISEKLFIALSTVKGHNRNIYSKLQVESRTEAIVRARELRLI